MRLTNLGGRASLAFDDRVVDVERRSGGRFSSDPMQAIEQWDAFATWAAGQTVGDDARECDRSQLQACVPRPRCVYAIGLNYRDHAEEAGLEIPRTLPSCLAGPSADVPLTSDRVDWEVELVVVIGRGGRQIAESRAFDHVAGYCVGQDISDRRLQFGDRPPQFSLGKSAQAFGPIGPALVSLDGVKDRDDLALTCDVDGERMQDSRTRQMIFSVSELVAYLSRTCELWPGDLIFTGTPSGVGSVREPRRYLAAGEVIASEIEGLGRLRNRCVAPAPPSPDV
ncbi:MAG: fumarylacetoacetate hydrolase family protein [Proteobacteria bacterium]|nr:fumarylacetoacetate hydrolase family protein [Pseudomonadota bacterium]